MNTSQIEAHLEAIKNQALHQLGVDAEQARAIALADSPDPALGDRGFPTFALARALRKAPPRIAGDLAQQIKEALGEDPIIADVIAAGPYVNFKLDTGRVAALMIREAQERGARLGAGFIAQPEHWMIEYSAPNTNKPQHLGHVRNDLLGESVAALLDFAGHRVTRVNLINDRGIHICKSMLMYERFGQGETPESTGKKGDHFVGEYYVMFAKRFKEEYAAWQKTPEAKTRFEAWRDEQSKGGSSEQQENVEQEELEARFYAHYEDAYFNQESELGQATRAMLVDWERGEPGVLKLWAEMNQWVVEGFEKTYRALGVNFDQVYYESQTYLLGKDLVAEGLERGIFEVIEGGAIACDLEKIGLEGFKILQRSNGTSVYMTQDLGTAMERFDRHELDRMVYVVGDEQRHHFGVLFGVLSLLRPELKGRFTHLSYGMVELPSGRMKTREGTTVDADDLIATMVEEALGEVRARYPELSPEEQRERAEAIGLAALKFFILYFNRSSTIRFNPKEAIDFKGKTGPYIMYAYARIQSIGRELGGWPNLTDEALIKACGALGTDQELAVIHRLRAWPHSLQVAARDLDPSKVAGYAYDLASDFSTLYNHRDHMIKRLEGARREALMALIQAVGEALRTALALLGVEVLEQM